MTLVHSNVEIDTKSGGLKLSNGLDKTVELHPLWVRERVCGLLDFDTLNHQRLYEHADIPTDLKITKLSPSQTDIVDISFSDGHDSKLNLSDIKRELGWSSDIEKLPSPQSWNFETNTFPEFDWHKLDDPDYMNTFLRIYFEQGYCVMQNTPTEHNSLKKIARRFGYLRETNFGELFNVETKPNPSDIAYTDAALASHTDNPYRDPVPGIQFLHCLQNEVAGGLSTLVDGMAIAERLAQEAPKQAAVLETVIVRFRYEGPSAILEHHGPIIQRDHRGIIRHIRLSSRVDYVPALDAETLGLFYAGRRRLH